MIAPSHGVIWRSYPEKIIQAYIDWSKGIADDRVLIIYDTMWHSTEKMAKAISRGIEQEDVFAEMINLKVHHRSDVMTEVLRNMMYAESPDLVSVGVVILDEVHYLQDPSRGAVWEEIIIHLDRAIPLVCLSATIANAGEHGRRLFERPVGVVDEDGSPLLDDTGETVTGPERDARQVFHRLAGCWTHWGREHDYFDTEEDAQAFHDELCFMLANQMTAPNSPQWFNTGLHWAYGITGPAQGHHFCNPKTGDQVQVPPKRIPYFKPGKELKELLNTES